MSISRYMVVAVPRCSPAFSGWPVRRSSVPSPAVGVGDERPQAELLGHRCSTPIRFDGLGHRRRVEFRGGGTQQPVRPRDDRDLTRLACALQRPTGRRLRLIERCATR